MLATNECTKDPGALLFHLERVPQDSSQFELIFSKRLTNKSAEIVEHTKIINIKGLKTSSYQLNFTKMDDNEHWNITLSNLTVEFVNKEL